MGRRDREKRSSSFAGTVYLDYIIDMHRPISIFGSPPAEGEPIEISQTERLVLFEYYRKRNLYELASRLDKTSETIQVHLGRLRRRYGDPGRLYRIALRRGMFDEEFQAQRKEYLTRIRLRG